MMIHKRLSLHLFYLCAVCLSASCSGNEFAGTGEDTRVLLQPMDGGSLTMAESRSIVNGISTSGADGTINKIGIYLTNPDDSPYSGIAVTGEAFTLQANGSWQSATPVYLSNSQKLYAYSPSNAVIKSTSGIPTTEISVAAHASFVGGNTWNCSNIDYLYGSASNTVGQASQIMASRTNPSPAIYMQHACAQVVFTMENASGRIPDPEYDYVKKITLQADGGLNPFHVGVGVMRLTDGDFRSADGTTSLSTNAYLMYSPNPKSSAVRVGNAGTPATVAYGLAAPRAAINGSMTLIVVLGKPEDATTDERELSVSSTVFNPAWEKGKRYEYKLSLSDRGIEILGTSITAWNDVSGTGNLLPDRN